MPELRLKDLLVAGGWSVADIALDEAVERDVLPGEAATAVRIVTPIVSGIANKVASRGRDITYVLTIASLPSAAKEVYKLVKEHVRGVGYVPVPATGKAIEREVEGKLY